MILLYQCGKEIQKIYYKWQLTSMDMMKKYNYFLEITLFYHIREVTLFGLSIERISY